MPKHQLQSLDITPALPFAGGPGHGNTTSRHTTLGEPKTTPVTKTPEVHGPRRESTFVPNHKPFVPSCMKLISYKILILIIINLIWDTGTAVLQPRFYCEPFKLGSHFLRGDPEKKNRLCLMISDNDSSSTPQPIIHTQPRCGPPPRIYALNPLGNAKYFRDNFVGRVFFLPGGKRMWWNCGSWTDDKAVEAQYRTEFINRFYEKARSSPGFVDEFGIVIWQDEVLKHIEKTTRSSQWKETLSYAMAFPELRAGPADFDSDPHLLNCSNGIVDLRSGELTSHDPKYKMTRIAGPEYDREAQAPAFMKFLGEITGGSQALQDYLQDVAGYGLTGSTVEQCLFLLHGFGSNGKSTLLGMLLEAAGEYGIAASPSTFSIVSGNRIRCDIARLAGARLVSAPEVNSESQLDESIVKQLTGGDRISARFLYQNDAEFTPNFKLFSTANHLPNINGQDDGIWRRIKVIPFRAKFSGEALDKDLTDKLRQELPGILTWMVQGAVKWFKSGLQDPPEVIQATATFRASMDHIGDFLEACCQCGSVFKLPIPAIYGAYQDWCKVNGVDPLGKKLFNQTLTTKGFEQGKSGSSRMWKGLRLKIQTQPTSGATL